MPTLNDPVVLAILGAAAAVVIFTILARVIGGRRSAAKDAVRRAEVRRAQGYLYLQQQEVERIGGRIIATSSTPAIAGFAIQRQIEAVFTDGHASPQKAVDVLKAIAAEKGANAIINLATDRPAAGKCVAHGDAVIVKPLEDAPAPRPAAAASNEGQVN